MLRPNLVIIHISGYVLRSTDGIVIGLRKLRHLTVPKGTSGASVEDSRSENLLQMNDVNSAGEMQIFSSYIETT